MMNYSKILHFAARFEALSEKNLYYIGPSKIHESGLMAANDIPAGTTIGLAVMPTHITNMGAQINHQVNCNAQLVEIAEETCALVSLKNISKDEEITANYKNTPWYIDSDTEGFVELG